MALSTPGIEQARRSVRTVDSTQAFVATIMSPSAGSRAALLPSLEAVDRFLEARTIEDFHAAGLRLDIHYVDFGFLASWLDEVIEDVELAQLVRDLYDTGQVFGDLVPQVKAIVRERIDQCDAQLAANGESRLVPAGS